MVDRPTAGTRIGPYVVRSRIAIGGMAEVYVAAEQRSAGHPRDVVIKRMLPQLASDPTARRMFEDEGRLGARIHHPNVARVLESSVDHGTPYLVLELVRGCDLWRLLRHLGREGTVLGGELAIFVGCELLAGLAAVHEARDEHGDPLGIVHQDVSPSNVLLSSYGDVKLSDLGIARTRIRDHFGATPTGDRMKGKLGYFAPEQVHGRGVDQRSDVFSAAVVIVELLLGRALFEGASELAILLAIRDADVTPLRRIEGRLPRGLAAVFYAALARDPEERTPNAAAFLEALRAFLPNEVAPLRRQLGDLVALAAASTSDAPIETTPIRRTRPGMDPSPEDEGRTTLELEPQIYEVLDGAASEKLSYAEAVERIALGVLRPRAHVRVGGAPGKPVSSIEELARHLPAASAASTSTSTEVTSFEEGGFVRAFVRAVLAGRTGVFVCERTSERKEVSLHEGVPSFVGSNVAGEMLGEFLVARSVVSRGELEMALAVMPRFDGRLGDTLIGLGLVEPVQLFRHIQVQVRERMLDLFTWTEGHASFVDGVEPREAPFPPEADLFAVLDEGLRRRQALDRPRLHLAAEGRVVRVEPPPRGLATAALGKPERLLIHRIKGATRLRDVIADLARDLGGDHPRAERAALLLEYAGALEFTA